MSGATQRLPGSPRNGVPFWPLAAAGGAILLTFVVAAIGGTPTSMPPAQVQATRLSRTRRPAARSPSWPPAPTASSAPPCGAWPIPAGTRNIRAKTTPSG